MSEIYYHVGRTRSLLDVGSLDLSMPNFDKFDAFNDQIPSLQSLIKKEFPGGISKHGQQYLLDVDLFHKSGSNWYTDFSATTEIIWELIRRLEFSSLPSRYQSFFAFEAHDAASLFQSKNGGTIYKIDGDSLFSADMNLLKFSPCFTTAWINARGYWGQSSGAATPVIEHLLDPSSIQILSVA